MVAGWEGGADGRLRALLAGIRPSEQEVCRRKRVGVHSIQRDRSVAEGDDRAVGAVLYRQVRKDVCAGADFDLVDAGFEIGDAVVAGVAGVMYSPILPPDFHMGMDFLVLSFVVVVVGGMGSLGGAVAAGFLLGILQSFASMNQIKNFLPGIDQIIIYLVAVVILLTLPRGLLGRKGVMEE